MSLVSDLEKINVEKLCKEHKIAFKFTSKFLEFSVLPEKGPEKYLKCWTYSRFYKFEHGDKLDAKGNYTNLIKLVKLFFIHY